MKTININGKDYTVEELTSILENAKQLNPMQELFSYHNTTEEKFLELNEHLSERQRGTILEEMMVEMYNKGEKPTNEQTKYAPWFELDENGVPTYYYWIFYYSYSSVVPSSLLFHRKEDMLEAVKKYDNIYKISRAL